MFIMEEKTCKGCSESKSIAEFGSNIRRPDGHQDKCRVCVRQYARDWKANNLEKVRETARNRYHTEAGRTYWLKRQFGISLEVYNDMLSRQGHVCAICNQACRSGRRLAVDHNHRTGEVRGLLCLDCNTALGKLQDSSVIAYQAARYLERSGA